MYLGQCVYLKNWRLSLEIMIENRMNCWESALLNAKRQSAAKPQTLLRKVQRLMGLASVLCNTMIASDTVVLTAGDDIVHSIGKPMGKIQLRAASAPFPYSLVLSPKQVWGSKGIIALLHDAAVTGSNSKPMSIMGNKGDEAMAAGYVGSLAGFDVYWSDQIDEDVSSGGDAAGFAMSKGALGLGVGAEGLFRVALERDEMLRAVNYVATGFWGEIEVKDGFGVYVLSDVS